MSQFDFFREWGIRNATKQPGIVDNLTEEAPVLAMVPMRPSTHPFQNVFEKIVSIDAAEIVDLDDELPDVNVTSQLEKENLSTIAGTMFVGYDKAREMGGAENYFMGKLPMILRQTGANTENSIIYNKMRQFAIDNGNVIDKLGAANTNYSIIAVKWAQPDITGLFNPNGPGDGKILEMIPLNGGNPYKQTFTYGDGSTKTITGFGMDIKTHFGLQLANDRYVGAIVNIDTAAVPTENDINLLLESVRANPANTFLYMHPTMKTKLQVYKDNHLQMGPFDADHNTLFMQWDGINIITSYNMLQGTEANV